MSGKVEFLVLGAQVPLDNRFAPALTKRKIFNAKNMKYKTNKTIKYKTIIKDLPRTKLSLHLHYFPRFNTIYAPRGRQTLCENRPPDDTYNAAIRCIRAANTCEQLRALVQRALSWRHLEFKETGVRNKQNIHDDRLTCHFMQLAEEYYELGFLQNIKYLESIAERYNIRKQEELKQQREICGRQLIFKNKQSAAYSASSSNSRTLSAQSSTSTTTASEQLQIIKRKRQTEINENYKSKSNWNAIRVQITPIFKYNKNNQLKYNNQYKYNSNNNEQIFHKNLQSMNDYLNANYYMNNCEQQQQQQHHQNTLNYQEQVHSQQQQQVHNQQHQINNNHSALSLLADLANLEIKSEADSHLPKITLTDCSTHNLSDLQQQQQTSEQDIVAFNNLKSSTFNLQHFNNLEIPEGEQNYQSEARPP